MLTWNLFHGRSLPPLQRGLSDQFARMLAAWRWDVALLQEVPPWWPQRLALVARARQRTALTSRNAGLVLRRALAERSPELMKSNGGGANCVLARLPIAAHRAIRLRTWPERRVAQLVRLGDGTCLANYHASARSALAAAEWWRLCEHALRWAGGAPLVIGGDLNLRTPQLAPGALAHVGARDVDHVFARGFRDGSRCELLDREVQVASRPVLLSDHVPLLVELAGEKSHTTR